MDEPTPHCVVVEPALEVRTILTILAKTVLFMVIVIFFLCVPLGDPDTQCSMSSLSRHNKHSAAVTVMLCNVYRFVSVATVTTGTTLGRIAEIFMYVFTNALYDAKLKFYNMLEKVDKDDLCRSVCCQKFQDENDEISQKRCMCKCKNRCCRKHKNV